MRGQFLSGTCVNLPLGPADGAVLDGASTAPWSCGLQGGMWSYDVVAWRSLDGRALGGKTDFSSLLRLCLRTAGKTLDAVCFFVPTVSEAKCRPDAMC